MWPCFFAFLCSSNSCEPNIQADRNPVFTNALFPTCIFLSYSGIFLSLRFKNHASQMSPYRITSVTGMCRRELYVLCPAPVVPSSTPPEVHHRQKCSLQQRSPCRLPFAASDHLPRCRQPRQPHYHHRLSRWTWGLHNSGREVAVFRVCLRYTSVIITCYFIVQSWVLNCPWVSYRASNE